MITIIYLTAAKLQLPTLAPRTPCYPHDVARNPIVTTDVDADNTVIIERYARRWSIEVLFEEGK